MNMYKDDLTSSRWPLRFCLCFVYLSSHDFENCLGFKHFASHRTNYKVLITPRDEITVVFFVLHNLIYLKQLFLTRRLSEIYSKFVSTLFSFVIKFHFRRNKPVRFNIFITYSHHVWNAIFVATFYRLLWNHFLLSKHTECTRKVRMSLTVVFNVTNLKF
jgi:hypothetical protein